MLSHAGIYHRHLQRRRHPQRHERRLVGRIVNVSADESVLGDNGKVDVTKLQPISYDPMNHDYLALGEKVGNLSKTALR